MMRPGPKLDTKAARFFETLSLVLCAGMFWVAWETIAQAGLAPGSFGPLACCLTLFAFVVFLGERSSLYRYRITESSGAAIAGFAIAALMVRRTDTISITGIGFLSAILVASVVVVALAGRARGSDAWKGCLLMSAPLYVSALVLCFWPDRGGVECVAIVSAVLWGLYLGMPYYLEAMRRNPTRVDQFMHRFGAPAWPWVIGTFFVGVLVFSLRIEVRRLASFSHRAPWVSGPRADWRELSSVGGLLLAVSAANLAVFVYMEWRAAVASRFPRRNPEACERRGRRNRRGGKTKNAPNGASVGLQ